MADHVGSSFVMHGAREAIAAGLTHVERHVADIEQAVADNPAYAFDLAKTLVESVCRTVLSDRVIPYDDEDDLPRLFRIVTHALPFLPVEASGETAVRKSLAQTLGGLHMAVQGICELRNRCGFASHGSSAERPPMESVQALLAAQAADTIVGFLYRVHLQDRTPAGPLYDGNPAFNDSIDEVHGIVRIYTLELRASEVLFRMQPETYRIYLAEFDAKSAADLSASDDPTPEVAS